MNEILSAVLLVGIIGLIVGVVLTIASQVFAVPTDERAAAVREQLPGANCGACGFSGCDCYAAALSKGEAKIGLCTVGGEETANAVAAVLGEDAGGFEKKSAVVHCSGTHDVTRKAAVYQGEKTCKAASMLYSGAGKCTFGCIGFGDCVSVCEYGAVSVVNGAAVVNRSLCRACGACAAVCPHGLITIEPAAPHASVMCCSCDKGAVTTKACKAGCVGCMRCTKACESGAITVKNDHAHVDFEKCTGCGKCAEVCPRKIIKMI